MTMTSSRRMRLGMFRSYFSCRWPRWSASSGFAADVTLLNVSYDPTREL